MKTKIKAFFRLLGPGLITGAADDDPSGVGTYSMAGAQLGLAMIWTAFLTWPLMAAVQMMCARIGIVTGKGLTLCLKDKLPRGIVLLFSVALLIANTLNIGADLAAMADSARMLTGLNAHLWAIFFALFISWATIRFHYQEIAIVLKWLTVFLFSYVLTAFVVGIDWAEVLHATISPQWPHNGSEWSILVAILGTTISPYLFYWQTSQEIEEDKCHFPQGHKGRRRPVKKKLMVNRKLDVGTGTFFSNFVMFFIILTTALTLHKAGIKNIETSQQAVEALRPLAGRFAATVYTLGLLGVGFLAIPTLTGSAAYALTETFGWREGLGENFSEAKIFYGIIVFSTVIGLLLNFVGFNPVKALYWSAVVNGVLAPFLLIGVILVASDSTIMRGQKSSPLSQVVVTLTALIMFFCAIAMFAT